MKTAFSIRQTTLLCIGLLFFTVLSCEKQNPKVSTKPDFYVGADLSYLNEVEDHGATFRSKGQVVDPFELFANKGANLIRIRLWNNPDWTDYSHLQDVEKSLARAHKAGVGTLLDFHYSDSWADPHSQVIPKAWAHIEDNHILGDSVYQYTLQTLEYLASKKLIPTMVQVGNETNSEVMQHLPMNHDTIHWERNAFLLQKGIKAVHDFNQKHQTAVEIMLHVAQPENALWWFKDAQEAGLSNYDWIGISYYPTWSEYALPQLSSAIQTLISTYQKKVMIVETAYPYTLNNADTAHNILAENALIEGFPPTPEGQKKYLMELKKIMKEAGGHGVVYWEPAWVTSKSTTKWGQGSHWDNATFFDADNQNEALPAFDFFKNMPE